MAFPRELLAPHEKIVLDLKPHWLALLAPALWTVGLAIAALVFSLVVSPSGLEGLVFVGISVAWFFLGLLPFLRWRFTMFVLTTDRLITRTGIIAKSSKEIPLENVNDVAFNQSVFGRMVGAGDLLVESAGERGQNRITNVRNPEQVQLRIFEEIENNTGRMYDKANQPKVSIPDQIEALARLKEQGILSDSEFERKKKELLDRL